MRQAIRRIKMRPVALRFAVFATLFALAGPAMSYSCEIRLPIYLRGYYEGDCDKSNDLPHGRGEARGADRYIGDWVQGKPSGKGVYIWENGARYEGEFKNGRADGKGLYTSPKGVRYEGGFVGGKLKELSPPDCPTTVGPLNC
jgi:hypothetical protein